MLVRSHQASSHLYEGVRERISHGASHYVATIITIDGRMKRKARVLGKSFSSPGEHRTASAGAGPPTDHESDGIPKD